MKHDDVAAIATQGAEGPHLVHRWNSPAGFRNRTEANIDPKPDVPITLVGIQVMGHHGKVAGSHIGGEPAFLTSGPDCNFMKENCNWVP